MDKISAINSIDAFELHKILTSNKLSNRQKVDFLRNNAHILKNVSTENITKKELEQVLKNRPLIRFRPLKNSFTKQGDMKLLAEALGVEKSEINRCINSVIDSNFLIQNKADKDNIEKMKMYVFRHGTKKQVEGFLEYELSDVKTTLQKLYKTLEYNSGGLADYFSRPIHRMDNNTLARLYNIIDKSLKNSADAGYVTDINSHAEWALIKIYEIQNNSKLIKAYDLYNSLEG